MKKYYLLLLTFLPIVSFSQSSFLPVPDNTPIENRTNVVEAIVATISYQGYDEAQAYFGEGEYEIFPDNGDGVLDRPIVVLDGFDPGDGRDITALYNSLTFDGQNLADILRDQGFDIVILNAPQYSTDGKDIDGGSDYIQRNAMVLAAMIDFLNAEKVGDEELVILGPSMGGLIARYALAYMEANSLPHETRLYISFDSPHRGANIPISLQYLINYLAADFDNAQAQAIIDFVLNSPAAKEMLVDHLEAHLLPGSFEQDPTKLLPEGAPDFRDAFQGELDALGFAQNVRNIAVVNGSGNGTTTGTPGMQVINTNLDLVPLTTADIILHFTPEASATNNVTYVETFFIGLPLSLFEADAESTPQSDGVDASPGGTSTISSALDGDTTNQVIIDFINALDQDEYSFIPTMSALAIDEDDWYAIPDPTDSPFDNTFIPDTNESHVLVTAENATFVIDEILAGTLGVTDASVDSGYVLSRNPVGDEILLYRNSASISSGKLSLTMYSMTGQEVFGTTFENPPRTLSIEHGLSSGVYLLQVIEGDLIQNLRMVVK